jgi:hypothetical protein
MWMKQLIYKQFSPKNDVSPMFGMPSVLSEKDAQCILYRINYSVDVDIKYSFAQFCAAKA